MSRVIVKGLPPRCSEQQLRDLFKPYGTISDCALKTTKEGRSRRFAFVGFEGAESGSAAISGTNETFLGSYRLTVEVCAGFGEKSKPRAWSKYAKDSSAYKRAHPDEVQAAATQKKPKKANEEEDEDESASAQHKKARREEEFKNFLDARGVGREEEQKAPEVPKEESEREAGLVAMLLEGVSGDTHLSVIVTGLPSSIKPTHVKEWLAPIRVKALKTVKDGNVAAAFVSFEKTGDVKRALLKNNLYLGGYRVSVKIVPGSVNPNVREDGGGGGGKKAQLANPGLTREEEEAKIRDQILDTGRLFLRNLPFSTTESDLRVLMKEHGELAEVQVIIAKSTGACKGFAIVEFLFPEAAVQAYAKLDGSIFKGRMLHILPGEEKREEKEEEGEGDGTEESKKKRAEEKSSYKREKAEKQKKSAAKNQHSWNALFLGANAVADSLAEKLGVSKADILGGEGGGESAAVRLALAETRIVRETRDFLLANGVRLDAFSRPSSARSDTVILVKNLPAGVQKEEMERMFEKFGDMKRVLIPPEGGASALIVFGNAVDAKAAFSKLAYARFRTQPLYLEWAPGDVFEEEKKEDGEKEEEGEEKTPADADASSGKKRKRGEEMTEEEKKEQRKSKKHKKAKEEVKEEEPEVKEEVKEEEEEQVEERKEEKREEEEAEEGKSQEDRGEPEENAVVFVKNLSWDTDDEQLERLFRQRFEIAHAKVSRKFNPADPSAPLSMGFGFVQFWTKEDAMEAIKTMQGALLAGHSIELKHSNRELTADTKKKQRKTVDKLEQGESLKLIVRNVPFQASPGEVESLFSAFGGLKSVRMPKKVGGGGSHRGFGFVDFSTKGDAKRAFDALVHSTHLYGRRLVLEWARGEDESVEQLREKTASRFAGGEKEHRKLKKRMEALEKDLKVIDDD